MAGTTPRVPEQFKAEDSHDDFDVSELLSNAAGAHSPFGELEFPVPHDVLTYTHPGPETRPRMAGGR